MSLAELLAYMVLSGIVLSIVGTLLVTALTTQRDVRDQATASSAAQVVLTDMENTLRNAVAVQTPSTFGGSMLIVKTRVGDKDVESSFQCRAWYWNSATGQILTVRGTPGPSSPTQHLSTSSTFAAWKVALDGVKQSSDGGGPLVIFSAEGTTGARIRFEVLDGRDGSSLTITSAAIPRTQGPNTGSATCF
jgi:type II secretory pathway pseudopilin PulG